MAKNNIVYFPGNKKVKSNYNNPAAVTTDNAKLVAKLNAFMAEKKPEDMAALINVIYRAQVLVVADFDAESRAMPRIIKDNNGNVLQPVFTDVQSIPAKDKLPHQGVLKTPFMGIVRNMLANTGLEFTGLCINFLKQGLTFTMPLLREIAKFDDEIKEGKLAQDTEFTIERLPKAPTPSQNANTINVMKDGKVTSVDKADVDPQTTIELKNPEVIKFLKQFADDKTNENLNVLITELVKSRVLIPARIGEDKKPVPLALKSADGENVQPVFAQKEDIGKEIKADVIMNIPFMAIVDLINKNKNSVVGLYINPFTGGVLFKTELVERIAEVESRKAEMIATAAQNQPVNAKATNIGGTEVLELETEDEYRLKERLTFDYDKLPTIFFANPQEVIAKLCQEKESYIDEQFENAYEDVRRYPYLSDEYVVTAMSIDDNSEFVFVQMPDRDNFKNIAKYVFLHLNKADNTARYFVQVDTMDKKTVIRELTEDKQVIERGEVSDPGNAAISDVINLLK